MRAVTQEEAEGWMKLAEQHGFVDEEGNFALGRYIVESMEGGVVTICFITPVAAGEHTEDLQKKTPPILFDRTEKGEIILPGRWWAHTFEKLSEAQEVPEDVRRTAAVTARHITAGDALLPADTDTIEITTTDDRGNPISSEALPPGTRACLRVQFATK